MISVCIPTYNYFALPLVEELARQSAAIEGAEVELVCIDDASTEGWRSRNAEIASMARWVMLDENIGRARIRNLFLQYAGGEYLLFLDNDMEIPDGFLQRYVDALADKPSVVVGGIAYRKRRNDPQYALRYMYGTEVESRSAEARCKDPYRSFMTGNFMVRRDVLEAQPFDESLRGYGHEDTLFGYTLRQRGVEVTHIENPAFNGQVETNEEYLSKTKESVSNLAKIYLRMRNDEAFCSSVRLIATYERFRKWHMVWCVRVAFWVMRHPLESHFLVGSAISVTQFNFYKLGLFAGEMSQCKIQNVSNTKS